MRRDIQIEDQIKQACDELEFRLYLLEWNSNGLCVYADKKDSSMSLLECEQLSKRIQLFLNDRSMTIEVSSPGIERKLKYLWHFEEAIGKNICVTTHEVIEGRKNFFGRLTKVSKDEIFLENPECMFKVPFQDIEKANIVYQMKNSNQLSQVGHI